VSHVDRLIDIADTSDAFAVQASEWFRQWLDTLEGQMPSLDVLAPGSMVSSQLAEIVPPNLYWTPDCSRLSFERSEATDTGGSVSYDWVIYHGLFHSVLQVWVSGAGRRSLGGLRIIDVMRQISRADFLDTNSGRLRLLRAIEERLLAEKNYTGALPNLEAVESCVF
jgi:hypothetical protein